MTKRIKSIISLVIALSMIAACIYIMPSSAETLDPSALLIEDFEVVGVEQDNTTERARPTPFLMGDHYVSSTDGGSLSLYRFVNQVYATESFSEYQRLHINDTGYIAEEGNDVLNNGRAITYRPKVAGEYTITRGSYSADGYVPWYVGYCKKGDYGYNEGGDGYIPEEWIHDKWGFNGFRYANNIVQEGNWRDISSYLDTGYIVYNINVPSDMDTDGVYLAISTIDVGHSWAKSDGTHYGEIAVGVPIENYYDTSVGGWQTVKVPMTAFDHTVNGGVNDVFVYSAYGSEWIMNNDYEDYRKYNDVRWCSFSGIGIVREDIDDTSCDPFYIDVKNLAVINDIIETPSVTAEFVAASECVALEWTGSGYSDTTYTITKSNGYTTETIDVGEDLVYVDRDIDNGNYTYKVTATVGDYELTRTSAKAEVEVTGLGGETGGESGDGVEKTVDTIKVDFDPMTYKSERTAIAYYKGPTESWNTFHVTGNYTSNGYQSIITDNDSDSTIDASEINPYISHDMTNNAGEVVSPVGTKNWGATDWAFEGFHFDYQWTVGDEASISEVPDEYWANIMNVEPYLETGYAVFEIDLGTNNTSTDGLYFALTGPVMGWALPHFNGTDNAPFTKENQPDITSSEHYATTVAGVDLADYYDISAGGQQVVAVPLKDIIENPTFTDMYGKAWGVNNFSATRKLDPMMISGMGIVKQDVDTSTVTTADVYMKQLKIMNIQTPENFTATLENGVVNLAWDGTSDKNVVYNVVKSVNGVKKYISTGGNNYYNDADIVDGLAYSYSVVAVDTVCGGRVMSPESASVLITSEGTATVEKVEPVLIDYQAYKYLDEVTPASYYRGSGSQYNDYQASWDWVEGGKQIILKDNNADDTLENSEINCTVQGLAGYGSPDGTKNWGQANWAHDGFRLQYYWTNGDETSMAKVPDERWGNVVDISVGKDSAYAMFEIKVADGTTATDGMFLATGTVLGTEYLTGFDETAGLPITKENQPNVTDRQHGATAIFGVPLENYYDFDKGGYQTLLVPITEFSQDAEFVDVFGKSEFGANKYDADAIEFMPELFDSMGVVKLDTETGALNVTTMEVYLKNLKVLNVQAPRYVTAILDGVNVVTSWPESATTGVDSYEVYRNGELIATTSNTYYTDTEASGVSNTYAVKAIHSSLGIDSALTYSSAVEIPVGAVKLYEGTGSSKVETNYVIEGAMTVSGYSVEAGNTLYVARYDASGRLLGAEISPLPTETWVDVPVTTESDEEIIKGFIWNTTTYEPASDTFMFKRIGIKSYQITYPSYGTKAVTFNINDGAATDAAVIELMHEYGINATFGLTDATTDYSIYQHDDFEIANHTTHIEMYLDEEYVDDNGNTVTPPTYDECVESISTVASAIETGTGAAPAGLVWPFMAPEERDIYNQLKIYNMTSNYEYARDSQVTGTFDLPSDWKDWGISAWVQNDNQESILEMADEFSQLNSYSLFKIFSVAGNGSDMTEAELLAFYEELFQKLSSSGIWKATNIELCRYIQATNDLEITNDNIYNPSDVTLYMIVNGSQWVAEPGAYAHPVEE